MVEKLNIGIIGVGRFGKNYLRTFSELENANVSWICSTKEATLNEALSQIKTDNIIKSTTNYKDILLDEGVDSVAIVTPASTHFSLVKEALESDKHVIVEKPLSLSSREAEVLIKTADERKKILMVGHIHLYNPCIQKLKADIKAGLFGKVNYIHSFGCGNGPVRDDASVLWDYCSHDVSILLYLLEQNPLSVSANGASYINKDIEDVATLDIIFPDNIFATAFGSWLYPLKRRELIVVGDKLYAVFDDYAQNEKLKYYDSRPKIIEGKIVIEDKGYNAPEIKDAKPLTQQLRHYLDCIENNKKPLTDGHEALKVVRILEYAQQSLKNKGTAVEIQQ